MNVQCITIIVTVLHVVKHQHWAWRKRTVKVTHNRGSYGKQGDHVNPMFIGPCIILIVEEW